MPQITLTSGKSFENNAQNSILDDAKRAGISLPYSCKTGRCSSCKCRVVKGNSKALYDETSLSNLEKEAGWILSCVRSSITDLLLEVEDLGDIAIPAVKTLPCRIDHIEEVAPHVIRVLLRLPPSNEFEFIPGQYIDVIGPNGIRRSYSLANTDFKNKRLELHIKEFSGGAMSDYWFSTAKPNDLLRINGPLGTFFLRNVADLDLVFLATGTGIAPVKAMLEHIPNLIREQQPRSVTVVWGAREENDLYLNSILSQGQHHYIPTLSRASEQWLGDRGYVQQVVLAKFPNLSNVTVYACGSEIMIESAKECLTKAGLPNSRFHSDAFVCSATV